MKLIFSIIQIVVLIAAVVWLLSLTSCSPGKYCDPKNIQNGKSSQHHDSKKKKAQIRIMWAKQYGHLCKVRYENKKIMLDRIYEDCDCKKIPVGTWVNEDSI
jgi:hypothetical protein